MRLLVFLGLLTMIGCGEDGPLIEVFVSGLTDEVRSLEVVTAPALGWLVQRSRAV